MDFLTGFKASSIVLTGAFGVLGLIKDFKDKKGTITKWGRISLAGILLSTGLGVIVQLRESSEAAQKEQQTTAQTLEIVRDIQRGLSPLDEPKFDLSFSVACELPQFALFCRTLTSGGNQALYAGERSWPYWPMQTRPSLFLEINFFVDPNDAELYGEGKKGRGNLWFEVEPTADDNSSLFAYPTSGGGVTLAVQDTKPTELQNDGRLKSILDIPGVTVVLRANYPMVNPVLLRSFMMKFKNGQSITYDGLFEKVLAPRFTCFRFKLPPKQ
jgi:hypothetical protein